MNKERERYRILLENLPDAFAYHQMVVNSEGKPIDYIFLEVNPAFEVMTGLERSEVINRRVTEVHPGIEDSSFTWIDTYAQVATTGQSTSFEQYFELASKWYEITAYSDQPSFFAVVFRDITERKYMEDAIRERERSHAVLLSNLPGMAYRCDFDRDWTMRFVSEGCYELTGYKPEELLENRKPSFDQVINPEYRDWLWESWNEILPKEKFQAEYTITTATGDIKWVWEQGQGIYDEDGNVVAIEGFISDITDNKLAKENLRKSEENLAITLQSIGDGVIATDNGGRITRMNLQAEKLIGWNLDEVIGRPLNEIFRIVSAKTGKPAVNPVYSVMQTGKTEGMANDTTLIARDGTRRQIADSAAPIFDAKRNILGVVMVFSDVTEQYQARKELKESEARFRLLAENAQDLIYRLRLFPDYGFEYVSPSSTSITGYTPQEYYDNPTLVIKTIHPEDRYLWKQIVKGKILIDEPLFFRFTKKNGYIVWIEQRGTPVYDESGMLIAIEGIARDITEIKRAEKEMLTQKAHFEALFRNTKDAIVYFDTERKGFNINKQFTEMFGYELEEIKGKQISEVIDPLGKVTDYSSPRILRGEDVKYESQRYNKLGESIEVLIKGGPVYVDGKITGGYTIYSDITNRKRAETELKYLGLHDSLTDMYNRTFFEEQLIYLEGRNDKYPITIVSIDVDGLKLINDTMGHVVGDKLLITCGKILKQCIRNTDILARVGGDEFIVIMPDTDDKTGEKIVKRIQTNTVKYNNDNPQLPISISMGVATAVDGRMSIKEAYRSADDSMYNSKLHKGASAKSHIINTLMTTLGERDYITEGHGRRLTDLSLKMGELKGLSSGQLDNLTLLAQVHDLGKVGIPDKILFKKGPLTDKEWKIMRQHSEKGYRIAVSSPDLSGIAHLILKHHERWDGMGYPLGISGPDIPVECRILSIVDAYDAMTNDRPYSKAKSVEEALTDVRRCAGTQFDPKLVDLFFSVIQK